VAVRSKKENTTEKWYR